MSVGGPARAGRSRVVAIVAALSFAGLLAITIVPPGATRVFSSPWSIVYVATLLGPVALLLLRAFDPKDPLVLPAKPWPWAGLAGVLTLLLSAALSPYEGSAFLWSMPLLAAIAAFYVAFDYLQREQAPGGDARAKAWRGWNLFFAVVAAASLIEWRYEGRTATFAALLAARNGFPLGHSNYTAGLAILMLPAAAVAAVKARGGGRAIGALGTGLGLALLFTSGSRAGMMTLAVMLGLAVLFSPLTARTKRWIALLAAAGALALTVANPRTRAMLLPADRNAPPNVSNVQREAMLKAGLRMGRDRPTFGWGPGTTPLVFPRYRAGLDGGAEDVLQLHSLPVQVWAETGGAGVLTGLFLLLLALGSARRDPVAAVTLAAYGTFSVFDAQLDVPVFGYAVACLVAALPHRETGTSARRSLAVGAVAILALGVTVARGRRDVTPELNAEALRLADVPNGRPRAIGLLQQALRANPDQEIAHFNLGWLLLVDDPKAAAQHFVRAAHLVPDKGGVYFGLGLARLNAGDSAGAAQAFALEALNDPVFLLSPWWKESHLAGLREPTLTKLIAMQDQLATVVAADTWNGRELRYQRAFTGWLAGQTSVAAVASAANTPQRRAFFERSPASAQFDRLGSETLRHERTGYPVLMRNLDVAPPVDAWVVQESRARSSDLAYLWPDKGWLPSPLLIALLDGRELPRK